jgi:hypothetical protein
MSKEVERREESAAELVDVFPLLVLAQERLRSQHAIASASIIIQCGYGYGENE